MSERIAELFRHLTAGVYVVGVADGNRRNAFTASSIMQVSFSPLLVAITIGTDHESYKLLRSGQVFASARSTLAEPGPMTLLRGALPKVNGACNAKAPVSNGSSSALACTTGAASGGRWAIITSDGSTATTSRSCGSYDPAPAPTFTTVRASPSATRMRAAIRGSSRRTSVYFLPIES